MKIPPLGLAAAAVWFAAAAVRAQAPAADALTRYAGLALSSQGDRVAAVETAPSVHGTVVVRDARGAVLARLDPCPKCAYGALSFSRGGDLAFVATDPQSGEATVRIWRGGVVTAAAAVKGVLGALAWSPDGGRIAVLATVGAHKAPGATQAGRPMVGEIGSDVDEQRLAIAPATGGPLSFVSPTDTYVYEFAWIPDGSGFVATAAKGDGDDNWWVAKLLAFDLAGRVRTLASPPFQMNAPTVSPDGSTAAFIGGLMSDYGSVGGDVYILPLAGGAPRDLTPDFHGTVTSLAWTGAGLRASALIGADAALLSVDLAGGPPKVLSRPALWPQGGRILASASGRFAAMVGESFNEAPEIVAGPPEALVKITHANASAPSRVRARSLTWRSDGFEAQGWLLEPLSTPALPRALLVQVHGGPSAAATPRYVGPGLLKTLIDAGYAVLMPNPRGSFGQGEAFTRANVKDLGGGDLRDILAGVDAAEAATPIDDHRLGVFGGSYGGFMAMWAATHTTRFQAAVAGAGVANWVSYYGQNGIDQWMIPFFGASAYDDPAVYDRLSPIRSIRNAKTPTFLYVGERDVECPPAQSIEFWHGLRAMGVPTSLVIYPGEGHGLRKPENAADVARRTLDWFARYLPPAPSGAVPRP